jgi:hypothetical protein
LEKGIRKTVAEVLHAGGLVNEIVPNANLIARAEATFSVS